MRTSSFTKLNSKHTAIAFRNGDSAAVRAMYDMLVPYAIKNRVPISNLKNQLRKEYNIDVNTVTTPAPAPTEQEIQIFEQIMEQYPADKNKVYNPYPESKPPMGFKQVSALTGPQPLAIDLGGGIQVIKNHPVFGFCISFGSEDDLPRTSGSIQEVVGSRSNY